MMNKLVAITLTLLAACSSKTSQNLDSFVEKAKDQDLSVLSALTLKPRGTHEDGSYKVHKIQYNRKEAEPLTIPVFDGKTSDREWLDSSSFQIREFSVVKGIDTEGVRAFSDSVVNIYKYLGVISIESYPYLGDFIIFQVNPKEQVIYVRDTSEVTYPFWKKFFREAEPRRKHWYYREKALDG